MPNDVGTTCPLRLRGAAVSIDAMLVVPRLWDSAGSLQDELRFMLVDRRPLFLAALAEIVRAVCPRALIDVTTDSEHALLVALERPVDLLFCEARATPLTGADLARRVRGGGLTTKVVVIGDPEDQELLLRHLDCGAVGFFTKDTAPEVFQEGMKAVLAGYFVLGRELLPPTLQRLAGNGQTGTEGQLGQLSKAERRILAMIGQAQSTRAIAASHGITEKTVRNHLASIYRKLQIRNRSEAIVWSARAELRIHPTPSGTREPVPTTD
jgi:DNA-binding NarL/FixJ family response regulator